MVDEYGVPEKADEVLEDYMFLDDSWVSEAEVHRIQIVAKGCKIGFKQQGHVLHLEIIIKENEIHKKQDNIFKWVDSYLTGETKGVMGDAVEATDLLWKIHDFLVGGERPEWLKNIM